MNVRQLTILLASASTLVLAGCATPSDSSMGKTAAESSASSAEMIEQQRKIARLESELRNKERQVESLSEDLQDARDGGSAGASASMADASGLFPPNPRPGECYARVIVPAQNKTTTKRVLKKEASQRIEIIPAKYETVQERVLVSEASTRLEVIPAQYEMVEERVLVAEPEPKIEVVPAQYKTVTERVLVKPASTKIVDVPAQYKTVTERVLDQPARTEWKLATGQGSGAGYGGAAAQVQRFGDEELKVVETRVESTGEVMCLVEIPATYKTIEKTMLVSPATTKTVEVPAEYATVEKRVLAKPATTRKIAATGSPQYKTVKVRKLVKPATTREVTIPAEYKTVSVRKEVQPAQKRTIDIPAEYETITLTEKISDERIEWRPVLCEVNMTPQNVSTLQAALNESGCCRCGPNRNECKIDGIMGPCTIEAARCYANKKGLPAGDKYITMEVVRALGLKL